jgi:hypothetical protein
MSVVLTEEHNIMVNTEELNGTAEYDIINKASDKPMLL